MATAARPQRDRRGRAYTPAIGPRLKPLLWIVLGGFALLGANGVYLASITLLGWFQGTRSETFFYYLMFLLHLVLGFLLIVPFVAFGLIHLVTSWRRPNRAAVRYGLALLAAAMVLLISGLLLVRIGVFEVRDPTVRGLAYWLHVATPLLAIALYIQHRLAGPRIHWEWARGWGGAVAAFVLVMALLHQQDPRAFGVKGPREGQRYFFPSEAVTATGNFIPARALMMDDYCRKCHQDAYNSWFHSAHHFSSFNNKAYLASVTETRQVAMKRDGNTRAARWCAGCHDPVPFFSGEFDDPNYDMIHSPTSQAGLTCTSCHAITHINSTRGNADYTIEEPQHYPFAYSTNPVLQWINQTLVKAKPEMHKRTFLKPEVHRSSEFCSTCHKVSLPYALNHYKDFLRGQNHWDTFLLSGVSGGGARSFYYPPKAKTQCADCHMDLVASSDFGARDFDGRPGREIHNHLFVGANTGLAAIRGRPDIAKIYEEFLKDKKVRIDLFALREGGTIDGSLLGPLRPEVPTLKPGRTYLVETVVRTLGLGHPFTQGTADSNEVWVELIARSGDRLIGRSGGIGPDGTVDPYAHFINIYMLDRFGNRIDRRNPQDIFVPLYNKQIPPGAGQVVHFALEVPEGLNEPIALEAQVNYRKFDRKYLDFVYGPGQGPELPVVVMAQDSVKLPVEGGPEVENEPTPIQETWQRWNDYGIGLFLEGGDKGGQKGELKQAEAAFRQVAELGVADGWVNLARVYVREGRIDEARQALEKASAAQPPAPWVVAWLAGQVNDRNGYFDEAIARYESVLNTRVPDRGFDFQRDYEVLNALGLAQFKRARQEDSGSPERIAWLEKAIATYRRTLAVDSENVDAHYNLGLIYAELGRSARGARFPAVRYDRRPSGGIDAAIIAQAEAVADTKVDPKQRGARAVDLKATIAQFLQGPRPEFGSRLSPLLEVVEKVGPAWERESDPDARSAMAETLAAAHKALHEMYKPDETAEGRAIAIARHNSKAADQNAQPIVIHSLHRPGAPGLDTATASPQRSTDLREASE
ncbi:MAG: tetratricopeptide repeat protein [Isosphaeraceae bacterium]|nr:tetratricopeptide repeat protein [Isosphaeraceae bacterium]